MRYLKIKYLLGLCLIWFAFHYFYLSDWSVIKIDVSFGNGNEIISAILQFKGKHHRPPDSLEELVPDFLTTIPQPLAGEQKWRYSKYNDQDGNFSLTFFKINSLDGYIYDSKNPSWGWSFLGS